MTYVMGGYVKEQKSTSPRHDVLWLAPSHAYVSIRHIRQRMLAAYVTSLSRHQTPQNSVNPRPRDRVCNSVWEVWVCTLIFWYDRGDVVTDVMYFLVENYFLSTFSTRFVGQNRENGFLYFIVVDKVRVGGTCKGGCRCGERLIVE